MRHLCLVLLENGLFKLFLFNRLFYSDKELRKLPGTDEKRSDKKTHRFSISLCLRGNFAGNSKKITSFVTLEVKVFGMRLINSSRSFGIQWIQLEPDPEMIAL